MGDVVVKSLIRAIQLGGKASSDAFSQIDNMFRPLMHTVLMRGFRVYDKSFREDMIQEASIKLFVSLREGKFRGKTEGELRKYLLRILRNHTLNELKGKKPTIDIDDIELQGSDGISISEPCEQKALEEFCKKYPHGYQNLLLVAKGMKLKDVAAADGRSYGAMREHISDMRKKLKGYFETFCKD